MALKPGKATIVLVILLLFAGVFYFYFNRNLDAAGIVDKTLKRGEKINSYHLVLEMEFIQDSEAREYFARVWFRNPHFFRVEFFSSYPADDAVPDQAIISDGEGTWLFSPEIGDRFTLDSGMGELAPTPFLLHTFFSGLAGSQESILLGTEKAGRRVHYILRTVPLAARDDHAYEEIWLEKRTLLPVKILIYDQQARLRQWVIFHKIIPNADIPEELFCINDRR